MMMKTFWMISLWDLAFHLILCQNDFQCLMLVALVYLRRIYPPGQYLKILSIYQMSRITQHPHKYNCIVNTTIVNWGIYYYCWLAGLIIKHKTKLCISISSSAALTLMPHICISSDLLKPKQLQLLISEFANVQSDQFDQFDDHDHNV